MPVEAIVGALSLATFGVSTQYEPVLFVCDSQISQDKNSHVAAVGSLSCGFEMKIRQCKFPLMRFFLLAKNDPMSQLDFFGSYSGLIKLFVVNLQFLVIS